MTLADVLFTQTLFPTSSLAWTAALLLFFAVLIARQWAFIGFYTLTATLPGARPANTREHIRRIRRADAERIALAAPLLQGAVGATLSSLFQEPLFLIPAALAALLCALGTARFCLHAFGPPGFLLIGVTLASALGAFAAGILLGAIAIPLVFLREGVWTPHLLFQAPFLGFSRLINPA